MKTKKFNILFVCRHNRFRSKFAEAYFKKINRNKNILVKSAGIFPGEYPLDKTEVKVARKLGVEIKGRPKPVTTDLLNWNDLLVLITNDLPSPKKIFNYGKFRNDVIVWKIKDDYGGNERDIENILRRIMERVEWLSKQLGGKK